jgi:transaldolase
VSIEVDPTLAYDTDGSREQAQQLHEQIDRPNLYVKIPGTEPGLQAIEDMIAAGRSINVTLIFSLAYAEVADALAGWRLAPAGRPRPVASVASFFVSRVDTEADRRLDELGAPAELRGRLAIANAKLAYQHYRELVSSERWAGLAAKGATPQRCLWASTSTKNPAYSDVLYVEELIGPETVNTLPEETIAAFQDHGRVAPSLMEGVDDARRVFDRLEEVGVDVHDVTLVLEREGVEKFADSFAALLAGIGAAGAQLAPA